MKTIFNQIFAAFFTLSFIFAPTVNAAVDCRDLFIPYDQKMPSREVLLEPGEQVWGTFGCKSCGDLKVSARPNKLGNQECPNCGARPKPADFVPPETVERGGRLFLLEPGDLIREADGTAYLARSGRGWTCGFCTGVNFQVKLNCVGCGAEKPTTIPAQSTAAAEMRIDQGSGINSGRAQTALEISKASGLDISSAATLVDRAKTTLDVQQKGIGKKPFLRTRAGALLMSAVGAAATGFIWWGTQTYTAPATVTDIVSNTAYVTYQTPKGENVTVDITPPNASVSIQEWRVGDKVTLYFRNLGGAKGAEGFDGKALEVGNRKK